MSDQDAVGRRISASNPAPECGSFEFKCNSCGHPGDYDTEAAVEVVDGGTWWQQTFLHHRTCRPDLPPVPLDEAWRPDYREGWTP